MQFAELTRNTERRRRRTAARTDARRGCAQARSGEVRWRFAAGRALFDSESSESGAAPSIVGPRSRCCSSFARPSVDERGGRRNCWPPDSPRAGGGGVWGNVVMSEDVSVGGRSAWFGLGVCGVGVWGGVLG
jgi:hypothetical protein